MNEQKKIDLLSVLDNAGVEYEVKKIGRNRDGYVYARIAVMDGTGPELARIARSLQATSQGHDLDIADVLDCTGCWYDIWSDEFPDEFQRHIDIYLSKLCKD